MRETSKARIATKDFQKKIIRISSAHPSVRNTRKLVTDRFLRYSYIRWPDAIPLPTYTRAETVADASFRKRIPRFGVPSCIMTDQGTQLESLEKDY